MKNRPVSALSVILVFLLLSISGAMAGDGNIPTNNIKLTSGWHGYVQFLVGDFSIEGLEKEGDDNSRITAIDANPSQFEEGFILPLWQVNYHFNRSKTTISLGTSDHGINKNDPEIEASISRELTDGTTLWASYAPKLSEFNSQIWQDPYLTGKQRKRTKTALEGVGLGADYLLGSALSLAYRYGELSIDNDDAGKSLSSRLTPTEIKQLQRGEERHHALLSLTFPLTDNFFLIPGASYTLTNAEGSANNYSSEELNLTVAYQKDSFEAFVEGYLVDAKYDEPNPVFRKKREDERYGITTGISYLNPFGWNNIKLDLLIGYSRENSNIHFFDSREEFMAAGLTYEY